MRIFVKQMSNGRPHEWRQGTEEVHMRVNELVVLGLIIFIALIASELWIEQPRKLIRQAQLDVNSESNKQAPTIIAGFGGGAQ